MMGDILMKLTEPQPTVHEAAAALCGNINRESVRSLRTYGLRAQGRVDRMWLRQVRSTRYEGIVYEGGVTLGQVRLPFARPADGCPEDGTTVVVWWDQGFTCAVSSELWTANRLAAQTPRWAA